MSENIQVQCSGAFYTSLHCDIINNVGIQEGFLKGEIEKHTSFDISDSDLNSENAVIKINISGYIPCATIGSFYNGCGKVNPHQVECLTNNEEEIVGWYRCRKCTNGVFLRETKVHEQLREIFSSKKKYFLFSLFTKRDETLFSTMNVSYKFQVMLNSTGEFISIPLNIINLNNTSAAGYIKTASSALYNSESLENILVKIQNLEPGVKEVESIHMGLIHQVQSLLPKFSSIQEEYQHVLKRVNHLREYCHNYEVKLGKDPDSLSMLSDKSASDKESSPSHVEKDKESKTISRTKSLESSNMEKFKRFISDENLKKNSKLNETEKDIFNCPSKNGNKLTSSEKDIATSNERTNKESLIASTRIKNVKPLLVKNTHTASKDASKGSKNETNVNIAKEAIDASDPCEETNITENDVTFSNSPEF